MSDSNIQNSAMICQHLAQSDMFGTLCGESSSSLTENFCFDLNKEMAVVRAGNSEC